MNPIIDEVRNYAEYYHRVRISSGCSYPCIKVVWEVISSTLPGRCGMKFKTQINRRELEKLDSGNVRAFWQPGKSEPLLYVGKEAKSL